MSTRKPIPKRLARDLPSHPGETLLEMLTEHNMSQSDLSARLGLSRSYICDVCKGRRAMTPQLAVRLESLPFYPPAELWMALQVNRDVALARRKVK